MKQKNFYSKKVATKMSKTAITIIMAIFIAGAVNAQTKTFTSDKGKFRFSYPSNYEQQKINNAPHMLVKLLSNELLITVSFWEYDFDNDVTIWDTDIYNNYLEVDKRSSYSKNDILCKKQNLNLTNKSVKVLKTIMLLKAMQSQEKSKEMKSLTYRMLHRGNYIQFAFFTMDINNSTFEKECENIMKGLELL